MKILFLTLSYSQKDRVSSYESLLQEFVAKGHEVYVACAEEKRTGIQTNLSMVRGIQVLQIKTGNITGNISLIEKGIGTITIDSAFKKAINKYYKGIDFDLIMYPTPPITLAGTVAKIKNQCRARTYLLLKDIFPQNAVDLGMFSKKGLKALIYKNFRKKEKKLYAVSDYIGCMSPANCAYVIKHNPEINPAKVEVCPNCVKIEPSKSVDSNRDELRTKYGIPTDKKVFVYGGNLGRPQGIRFLIKCLKVSAEVENAYFLIIGKGTDKRYLIEYMEAEQPKHVKVMEYMPKEDYDRVVAACDVGMIFLDYRFTIPNYPSRLLSCLRASLPVLAATDLNTDIGKIAEEMGYGLWCESRDGNEDVFAALVDRMCNRENLAEMGRKGRAFLETEYSVEHAYDIIMKHFS